MITIDIDKLLEGIEPVKMRVTKPEELYAYVQACDRVVAEVGKRLPKEFVILGDINLVFHEDWSTPWPEDVFGDTLTDDEHTEYYEYLVTTWQNDILPRLNIDMTLVVTGVLAYWRMYTAKRLEKTEWPYKVWRVNSST